MERMPPVLWKSMVGCPLGIISPQTLHLARPEYPSPTNHRGWPTGSLGT